MNQLKTYRYSIKGKIIDHIANFVAIASPLVIVCAILWRDPNFINKYLLILMLIIFILLLIRYLVQIWRLSRFKVILSDNKLIFNNGYTETEMMYSSIKSIDVQATMNLHIKDFSNQEIVLKHKEVSSVSDLIMNLKEKAVNAIEEDSEKSDSGYEAVLMKKRKPYKRIIYCAHCNETVYTDEVRPECCPQCGNKFKSLEIVFFKNEMLNKIAGPVIMLAVIAAILLLAYFFIWRNV